MANYKNYNYLSNAYNKKYSVQYNKLSNDYDKYSSSYEKYHPSFTISDVKTPEVSKSLVNYVSKTLTEYNNNVGYLNIDNKRSPLDRVFDSLQVGQYSIMGGALGALSDDLTVWEGFTQGLRASNPLGDGYDKWEYSFSDVIGQLGWQPETGFGKFAKGAVGLAGDIFLDPVNYLSGGIAPLITGTGKASAKLATKGVNLLDSLGDAVKFIDNVDDLKGITKMTQEVAEAIVKNSTVYKSGMEAIDVVQDASSLANKYNSLLGIKESADVVMSLKNVPFGKKMFGKIFSPEIASKEIGLFSDAGLRAIGDKTLAPIYAQIRDGIFGSGIGKKLSPNHQLYKLAGTHPEQVYNHMKILDAMTSGSLNQIKNLADIKKYAQEIMGLSPKEQEEVMALI